MIFDGLKFTKVNNIVARKVQSFERQIDGGEIHPNYCMFVEVKNVKDSEHLGYSDFLKEVILTKSIPCKLHTASNIMHGESRVIKRRNLSKPVILLKSGVKIKSFCKYIKVTPVYLVKKAIVYKHTIKVESTKDEYYK